MGNSNSNFSTGKNKEILDKLKNLLAESESKPEIMAGCNDLISKLKTLVEDSEANTGGRYMSNDFKVNAVSGDSENLPAPEIVAAEIDVVAVGMPSRSAFETTEKPAETNIMASMDEMFGGSIMDGIKSLLGAANNTEHETESNEMNVHVNNLKQLLEQTEDNVMMGGAIDVTVQRLQHLLAETESFNMSGGAINDVTIQRLQHLLAETESFNMAGGQVGAIDDVTVQRLQHLLAETEQNVMAGGAINNVDIQHLQNLLAETESFSMAGGQVDEYVNNLRNLLVQSESNFNYQTVNLRGGQVESENLFTSENQPQDEDNDNYSEQSGGKSDNDELSSELVEILKSLKKENNESVGGAGKGRREGKDSDPLNKMRKMREDKAEERAIKRRAQEEANAAQKIIQLMNKERDKKVENEQGAVSGFASRNEMDSEKESRGKRYANKQKSKSEESMEFKRKEDELKKITAAAAEKNMTVQQYYQYLKESKEKEEAESRQARGKHGSRKSSHNSNSSHGSHPSREWKSERKESKERSRERSDKYQSGGRKSSRKSSRKSRRMSDSDSDLNDMDMDTDDEDYLSTSSLNTSDINIRHYR